jgi:iron-sulfur cluster repair protein YtfE (RIC family)
MNAFELLKQDHVAVTKLLAEPCSYADMRRRFQQIRDAIQMHVHIEERIFYPKLQSLDNLKELVRDAKEQHALINQLLDDMQNQQGQEFEKNFQTLKGEVQLYITSEEHEIFPHAEKLKTPSWAQLGNEMETAKAEYQAVHKSSSH